MVKPADSFIHSVVCLTTGPKPLPKAALHIVRSRASSFKRQYPLLSLRSSSSFLRLLPRLPVTSIPPCTFPSITCFRRQFLRKMWPIQFAFPADYPRNNNFKVFRRLRLLFWLELNWTFRLRCWMYCKPKRNVQVKSLA